MRPSKRIRRDSPFASFRGARRLGAEPVTVEGFGDEMPAISTTLELPSGHPAVPYIGYRQNDANVISFEAGNDAIILTLQHYDVWRLACRYAPKICFLERTTFPVRLVFRGVRETRLVRLVEHGATQFVRSSWRKRNRFLDLQHFKVEKYDDDGIRCRVEIYSRNCFQRRSQIKFDAHCDDYALCIDATTLDVEEDLRGEWEQRFGPDALFVFDKFMAAGDRPFYGLRDFDAFLAEIRAHGTPITAEVAE